MVLNINGDPVDPFFHNLLSLIVDEFGVDIDKYRSMGIWCLRLYIDLLLQFMYDLYISALDEQYTPISYENWVQLINTQKLLKELINYQTGD